MEALGSTKGFPRARCGNEMRSGRLHRLLEAEPMLICVCQSGPLPASVLVRSTRSYEDFALARMVGRSDDPFLLHPLHD
jgi:hypothetical protein